MPHSGKAEHWRRFAAFTTPRCAGTVEAGLSRPLSVAHNKRVQRATAKKEKGGQGDLTAPERLGAVSAPLLTC
jgi:hypothetical protein